RFFDVAVRDVAMAIGAFTLARLTEAGVGATASERRPAGTNRLITAALVIAAVPLASVGHVAASDHRGHSSTAMSAAATLHQNMRALWSDHVIWTRAYVVAAVADGPDQQAAAARLMKNQEDIGAAVAAYYGQAAGVKLTELLKAHISIAVDLIRAAKAGD